MKATRPAAQGTLSRALLFLTLLSVRFPSPHPPPSLSYHPRTGEKVVQLGDSADKDEVTCMTVGPGGTIVATGNRQGKVKIW